MMTVGLKNGGNTFIRVLLILASFSMDLFSPNSVAKACATVAFCFVVLGAVNSHLILNADF
jgi:hypothetical protein